MDQEKFDQHLMDYLFDELDEVTRAAMKRKIEADADCRQIEAGLRATIELARLPIEEPDFDLEERILAAALLAEQGEPWHRKLLRSLSWAGSHAMRPQLAMAAILVLVLGSSVLLLRARPGSMQGRSADATVPSKDPAAQPLAQAPGAGSEADANDEVPSPDRALPHASAVPAPPATVALAPSAVATSTGTAADEQPAKVSADDTDKVFAEALRDLQDGNFLQARRGFATVNSAGGPNSASAALYEARATRAGSGCKAAVTYYERLRQRYGMSGVGAEGSLELVDCYRQLGQTTEARRLLVALSKNPEYNARAVDELSNNGQAASTGGGAVAAKRQAAAPAPAASAATKPGSQKNDKADTQSQSF